MEPMSCLSCSFCWPRSSSRCHPPHQCYSSQVCSPCIKPPLQLNTETRRDVRPAPVLAETDASWLQNCLAELQVDEWTAISNSHDKEPCLSIEGATPFEPGGALRALFDITRPLPRSRSSFPLFLDPSLRPMQVSSPTRFLLPSRAS